MTSDADTTVPEAEKKFRCPVHGEFDAKKWAPHRRWCRAGARGKLKAKQPPSRRRLPKRKGRRKMGLVNQERTRPAGIRVVHGAKMGMVVFKNGKKEIALIRVAYADEKGMVQSIRKAIEKALG